MPDPEQGQTPYVPIDPETGQQEELDGESGNLYIDETPSSQQIQEILNGEVVSDGYSMNLQEYDPGLLPQAENETMYKKRMVKIVNGKIVATSIVYIKRYLISASGGFGDGYALFRPDLNGTSVTYVPITITLS